MDSISGDLRHCHSTGTALTCNKLTQLHNTFIGHTCQHHDLTGCCETKTVGAQLNGKCMFRTVQTPVHLFSSLSACAVKIKPSEWTEVNWCTVVNFMMLARRDGRQETSADTMEKLGSDRLGSANNDDVAQIPAIKLRIKIGREMVVGTKRFGHQLTSCLL